MGLKYTILNEIKKSKEGLTVKELCVLLNKTQNSIRPTIHRDLKPYNLVIELDYKRDGSKIYDLPIKHDNEKNDDILTIELIKHLKMLMDLFQQNAKYIVNKNVVFLKENNKKFKRISEIIEKYESDIK